jgi:hypothetical protein
MKPKPAKAINCLDDVSRNLLDVVECFVLAGIINLEHSLFQLSVGVCVGTNAIWDNVSYCFL